MHYIIQAALSSKAHPEYGVATIDFPIPNDEYDHTIEMLESMGIGDVLAQDCQVDSFSGKYPVLNCLSGQNVNVDELDYLAKRLDSFCTSEDAQFQAMAHKLGISDIKDFINLTFSCQEATVITDFANLEQAGKSHSLTINSGSMSMEEFDKVDGLAVAQELIQNSAGVVTPYGVVYDNGMKLEQVYDGGSFPQYLHNAPLLTLGVPIQREIGGPVETAWLYLPMTEQQVNRTLRRIGITCGDAAYFIEDSALPSKVFEILERPDDPIMELNCLCHAVAVLDKAEQEKLDAVILMAKPIEASEVRQLAENLDQFEFVPDVQTLEDYGMYMIQESGDFKYDENLEGFYDYRRYGEVRSREDSGEFTDLGYVSYHGTLALDELMQDDPTEQEQGPTMGGFS